MSLMCLWWGKVFHQWKVMAIDFSIMGRSTVSIRNLSILGCVQVLWCILPLLRSTIRLRDRGIFPLPVFPIHQIQPTSTAFHIFAGAKHTPPPRASAFNTLLLCEILLKKIRFMGSVFTWLLTLTYVVLTSASFAIDSLENTLCMTTLHLVFFPVWLPWNDLDLYDSMVVTASTGIHASNSYW